MFVTAAFCLLLIVVRFVLVLCFHAFCLGSFVVVVAVSPLNKEL